ncbi:hypothetical protein ID866_10724 [Astraeus odoratus]|nr:hypothetical protein ID866_10724 [Astraeus odoratus]
MAACAATALLAPTP